MPFRAGSCLSCVQAISSPLCFPPLFRLYHNEDITKSRSTHKQQGYYLSTSWIWEAHLHFDHRIHMQYSSPWRAQWELSLDLSFPLSFVVSFQRDDEGRPSTDPHAVRSGLASSLSIRLARSQLEALLSEIIEQLWSRKGRPCGRNPCVRRFSRHSLARSQSLWHICE